MRGATKGVKAHLICASHRLNLLIADAPKSSVVTISFFGYLQRMYKLFYTSTKRWDILKKHVTKITVKNLPDTHWEAKCLQSEQDAQLSQRDRAAGCVIVFARSRRLELGDNILQTL